MSCFMTFLEVKTFFRELASFVTSRIVYRHKSKGASCELIFCTKYFRVAYLFTWNYRHCQARNPYDHNHNSNNNNNDFHEPIQLESSEKIPLDHLFFSCILFSQYTQTLFFLTSNNIQCSYSFSIVILNKVQFFWVQICLEIDYLDVLPKSQSVLLASQLLISKKKS